MSAGLRRGAAVTALAAAAPGLAQAQALPSAHETRLLCEVVYLPARTTWNRTVAISDDGHRVLTVQVDGIPVYAFAVRGTLILTALDNERILVDTAGPVWRSDFRGAASGQGRCERVD